MASCFPAGTSHPGLVAKPFEKVTYNWMVPPHAGPTAQDPACLTWMYFSAADPIRDTNSGLVGPLLVCKAGALGADGKQVLLGSLGDKTGRREISWVSGYVSRMGLDPRGKGIETKKNQAILSEISSWWPPVLMYIYCFTCKHTSFLAFDSYFFPYPRIIIPLPTSVAHKIVHNP